MDTVKGKILLGQGTSCSSGRVNHAAFERLDGLARSMAYEFEYSWEVDLHTAKTLESLKDPRLPGRVLAE